MRILCGRAWRSVRNERAAAGHLWSDAPVVSPAFSRNLTGLFPACQPDRYGGLLGCGIVGSGCDALLRLVPAADPRRDLSGTVRQSSILRRCVPQIRVRRIDWNGSAVACPGVAAIGLACPICQMSDVPCRVSNELVKRPNDQLIGLPNRFGYLVVGSVGHLTNT